MWEDNTQEWTRLEFAKSERAVENWEKKEGTGCEIIGGASTTLAVKGYMTDEMRKSDGQFAANSARTQVLISPPPPLHL